MATKANAKLCETSEIELFRELLAANEANLESYQTCMIELLGFYGL